MCVFCDMIRGKVTCQKIYETNEVLVFLDKAQDVDYHLLAVPKKHVTNLLDCDAKTLQLLLETIQYVATYCVDKLGFAGANILSAANQAAGQSVSHFHIHLILRKEKDGINAWPTFTGATKSVEKMQEELKIVGPND